ncbi:MAG: hypothetical protein A3J07_01925 [Candidatus Doudnabacteria bacterium RIFCSPLOWO2_02_FULL_49_13]|uniref:Uncharacterized protein n=1 Tax=Candidatus Doudnabacteria bacterium RIFCSPHIGHO2_12_FULL_48_16 TaxID=1817838 RepID=A0A1F5PLL3_9BACT|nr:MAG: hypothetical protein A3B77_00785 [Candidatus Doudnabacteria bacterium RIFCSPHIGHO2_02_FULL_49_24]OGE88784.1 MAG: hypothetical protein A2760_01140 [Candidatus Doudnabacteria bacterium RIFCSPHIGHO2_01_FULL_50_67]OGE90694.1 MAG: hypothetical protein A3E29_01020 [Candidatus Doudnabacteria bacterium RIFCSPHIGHO2_12_FULL_48_16]OGE97761.1 MAG: hypothetical protein A2990_03630 [Candidatus Doudnabacteria bacterium RIFCSPLOWO2_01_FULL_49_40]OGF02558.1 MAG: hypothetical protein A3J07_01925 [Candid
MIIKKNKLLKKSNGVKKSILLLTVLILVMMPLLVQGANPCTAEGLQANSNDFNTLPKCINQIYVWSLGLSSLLAVLMVVLGGYYVMTSAGNAEQATKGKEYIWGAVIGLVLLFTAYLLLRVINPDLINLRFGNPACVKNGQKTAATTAAACKASGGDWSLFYVEPPVTNPNSQ